jgi:hypothetical protein
MRRVPAILLVIFLVCPLFFAALLTVGVSTWALDRGFYLGLLNDARLYQIPDATSSASWVTADVPGLRGLSVHSAGRAAREVITPAYMMSQATRVLNQVFDFLQGRSALDITLDMTPVKKALSGDAGKRFSRILAEDLPVGGNADGFTVRPRALPGSRPSSLSVEKAAVVIQAGLPTFASSIPDTVRLSDTPPVYFPGTWRGGRGFSAMGFLVLADVVLLVLAGGIWTAAAFIGGANTFQRLQWFGWSLFVPAVGVFLIGLFVDLSMFSHWVSWGIESAALDAHGFGPSFVAALVDVARRALSRVGTGFLATGAIAGGIALGLLGRSWSIPAEQREVTT